MQPDPLAGLRFVNRSGERIGPDSLHVVECVKGADRPRSAWRVSDGQNVYLMKLRRLASTTRRFRATFGRSYLRNEATMTPLADDAGLPVPRIAGSGRRTRWGLITHEALLVEWLDNHTSVGELVADAYDRDDGSTLDRLRCATAMLLAQVRQAGLADKDFGVHNLMTPSSAPDPGARKIVWVDLERVYLASPTDAPATCGTVGGALVRWWLATRGDQSQLEAMFGTIRVELPVPDGGWPDLMGAVNDDLQRRAANAIRRGQVDRKPQRVGGAG